MSAQEKLEKIDLDNARLSAALEEAQIPSLMLALVHLTGDMSLIRGDIQPQMAFLSPDDGLTEAQRATIRSRALEVLASHRDDPKPFYMPTDKELEEMLSFLVGQEVTSEYVEFLTSELALHGEDPYAQPKIEVVPVEDKQRYKVLVLSLIHI